VNNDLEYQQKHISSFFFSLSTHIYIFDKKKRKLRLIFVVVPLFFLQMTAIYMENYVQTKTKQGKRKKKQLNI